MVTKIRNLGTTKHPPKRAFNPNANAMRKKPLEGIYQRVPYESQANNNLCWCGMQSSRVTAPGPPPDQRGIGAKTRLDLFRLPYTQQGVHNVIITHVFIFRLFQVFLVIVHPVGILK